MAGKKGAARMKRKKEAVKKVPVKTDIASVEEETVRRVNRTLTAIDGFLAKWDASKVKPDDMFPQIVKIKQFHDALLNWQKASLKGKRDEEARMRRLRDFVLICKTYS
jgi:hypothetical protein